MAMLLTAGAIFLARVIELALSIFRLLFTFRGNRLAAWIFGFIASFIFVSVVRQIFVNVGTWPTILAYALGFATGNLLGMFLEARFSSGYGHLCIFSPGYGDRLADLLEAAGYAPIRVPGRGRDGMVTLLACTVPRQQIDRVLKMVRATDPDAFLTVEEVRLLAAPRGAGGKLS